MKQLISTILNILNRDERRQLFTHVALDLVIGMLDVAFLAGLLLVINFYTTNAHPPGNIGSSYLTGKDPLLVIGLFFVAFSLKNWIGFITSRSQYVFFYKVASRLSRRNIYHYLQEGYMHFVNTDSSVYIRKISQQPIEFSNYILTNVQQVISQGILIVFTVAAILFYHPGLFISLFVLLLPPVIALAYFIKTKLKHIRDNIKTTSQMTIQHLQESLSGYVESNIYDKNDFFADRFYRYQQQLNDNIATQQTLQALPSRLIEVFAVLGFLILVAVNKLSANAPAVDMITIGVFVAASYKIIPGIIKILNCTGQIRTYQFTLNDLALPVSSPGETFVKNREEHITSLEFEHVNFSYNDSQVLNDVNFKMAAGDFAGISAPSGKGKTTIINLLLGFLQPASGTIYLNNNAATADDLKIYRNKISYVKQQPFFMHDSILKNVTLTDNEYNRERLEDVLAVCGIDKLLQEYPEGLEKTIKENGKNISGGQRQRIMLARALYHDFDLLILDEPFGEMDDCSERAILAQLQGIAERGKMIIFITHNKSSLSFCNKTFSPDGE